MGKGYGYHIAAFIMNLLISVLTNPMHHFLHHRCKCIKQILPIRTKWKQHEEIIHLKFESNESRYPNFYDLFFFNYRKAVLLNRIFVIWYFSKSRLIFRPFQKSIQRFFKIFSFPSACQLSSLDFSIKNLLIFRLMFCFSMLMYAGRRKQCPENTGKYITTGITKELNSH